jgi:hypothetical protein
MRRPRPMAPVPHEPVRVARAAVPQGNRDLRRADAVETWGTDDALRALFPTQGQPAWPPWRLARATIRPCAAGLSERQAAHAVRRRLDGTSVLRLALTAPGCEASGLRAFRARLLAGTAACLLFDTRLTWGRDPGLVTAGGRPPADRCPADWGRRAGAPSPRHGGPGGVAPREPVSVAGPRCAARRA